MEKTKNYKGLKNGAMPGDKFQAACERQAEVYEALAQAMLSVARKMEGMMGEVLAALNPNSAEGKPQGITIKLRTLLAGNKAMGLVEVSLSQPLKNPSIRRRHVKVTQAAATVAEAQVNPDNPCPEFALIIDRECVERAEQESERLRAKARQVRDWSDEHRRWLARIDDLIEQRNEFERNCPDSLKGFLERVNVSF